MGIGGHGVIFPVQLNMKYHIKAKIILPLTLLHFCFQTFEVLAL